MFSGTCRALSLRYKNDFEIEIYQFMQTIVCVVVKKCNYHPKIYKYSSWIFRSYAEDNSNKKIRQTLRELIKLNKAP